MVKTQYSLSEVKAAVKALTVQLKKAGIRVSRAILFGSYARGDQRDYSDIDLAIISPDFRKRNRLTIQGLIGNAVAGRTGILSVFEFVGFSTDEYSSADDSSFLGEIKRIGKSI